MTETFDTIVIKKRKYHLVPAAEFKRMMGALAGSKRQASPLVPGLPPADARGNRPALAFADAAIARTIVKRRRAAGLTQRQLADAAGVRVEVLNRAERGAVIPSVRTLTKLERALRRREGRRS